MHTATEPAKRRVCNTRVCVRLLRIRKATLNSSPVPSQPVTVRSFRRETSFWQCAPLYHTAYFVNQIGHERSPSHTFISWVPTAEAVFFPRAFRSR